MSNVPRISETDVEFIAIRAQGAGGQNVNKVSSAIHLRFDIRGSSLPEAVKERLLRRRDHRITEAGQVVIKAQRFRTQEKNRRDALDRLQEMINEASQVARPRRATKPTRASQRKRLEGKARLARTKSLRGKVTD